MMHDASNNFTNGPVFTDSHGRYCTHDRLKSARSAHLFKVLSMTESTFENLAVIAVLMRRAKRIEKGTLGTLETMVRGKRKRYRRVAWV
ncbi:hypothetical protein FOVSG1_009754 [Fusarium oxysporum f. sp. vasinfectum]